MVTKDCFSQITTDVFPPWHCVNIYLNAIEQQKNIYILTFFYRTTEEMSRILVI